MRQSTVSLCQDGVHRSSSGRVLAAQRHNPGCAKAAGGLLQLQRLWASQAQQLDDRVTLISYLVDWVGTSEASRDSPPPPAVHSPQQVGVGGSTAAHAGTPTDGCQQSPGCGPPPPAHTCATAGSRAPSRLGRLGAPTSLQRAAPSCPCVSSLGRSVEKVEEASERSASCPFSPAGHRGRGDTVITMRSSQPCGTQSRACMGRALLPEVARLW